MDAPRNENALGGDEPTKAGGAGSHEPVHSTGATLEAHPLCLLLPDMSADDFANLKADIQAHGLLHPVLLHEGKILDGRHRARACDELDVEASYQPWSGDDPLAFVLSENLHRRHLTASQRAMIAASAIDLHRGPAQARQKAGTTLAPRGAKVPESGKAAAVAATSAGVSPRSVERAIRVQEHGTPEDAQEVLTGKVPLKTKVREIAARHASAPTGPAKPTAKAALHRVLAVTAALADLGKVDAALDRDDARRLVEQLEAALERYRPMAAAQGADHA